MEKIVVMRQLFTGKHGRLPHVNFILNFNWDSPPAIGHHSAINRMPLITDPCVSHNIYNIHSKVAIQ